MVRMRKRKPFQLKNEFSGFVHRCNGIVYNTWPEKKAQVPERSSCIESRLAISRSRVTSRM